MDEELVDMTFSQFQSSLIWLLFKEQVEIFQKMVKFYRILAAFLLVASSHGQIILQDENNVTTDDIVYNYVEEYFEVPLDHFSFARPEKFRIRYLVNDSWWDKENNGPIFLYTGNEGSIDAFAINSGFMWEIAQEFGALLLFAEHRFYGLSSPSESLKHKLEASAHVKAMGYLTVSQALADFADLVAWFKKDRETEKSPVIAFGGSYGGVLTAWMRMKYPHIVAGGIASSAPFYLRSVPCETYDAALASIFGQDGNANCVHVIRKSWDYLDRLGNSSKGRKWLSKTWKLCQPVDNSDDISTLKDWLETMYSFLGMANYPYPADFLQDLPAYPVKKFCSHLKETDPSSEKEVIRNMFEAINVYLNNSGTVECFDYSTDSMYTPSFSANDDLAFNYQSCTELIDPECDDGIHDFFQPEKWNLEDFSNQCYDVYKVRPRPNLTDLLFGGKDIIAESNIVFSNGLLDPWYAYGVLGNMSESLIAVHIQDAAHHLDLRASNPADPPSVVEAREIEKSYIHKWIKEYHQNQMKIENAFASFS